MNKKNKEDLKKLIKDDDDFVYCPRLGNSLKRLIERNPDGIDDNRISKVLLMDIEQVNKLYLSAINKIRKSIGLE